MTDRTYTFTIKELAELVDEAIAQLTNMNCPHCQCYIGTDMYLESKDITDWLLSRLGA